MRKLFTPPDLSILASDQISQFADEAELHAFEWLVTNDCAGTSANAERLRRSRVGRCVAKCFPASDRKMLFLAADTLMWMLAFDDVRAEEAGARELDALVTCTARLVRVLESADGADDATGFVRGLDDLVVRMRAAMTPRQYERIACSIRGTLLSLIWEASAGSDCAPCLPDYLTMRRYLSFGRLCVALVEPVNAIMLPPHHRDESILRELEDAVCNLNGWVNDLFSYAWENHHARAALTLPTLISRERRCSIEDAFDLAARMCQDEALKVKHLSDLLRANPLEEIRRYADALVQFAAGSVAIYPELSRYAIAQRPSEDVSDAHHTQLRRGVDGPA